eukprot:s5765_g2.t1
MWQSNAAASHRSLGTIFVDVRAAFYRIVKPMLASIDGTQESVLSIFRDLKLPASAYQDFVQNIGASNLVHRATNSQLIAGQVAASLDTTWFVVPNSNKIHAPRTGSRPGDPCADILFGYVLAQMLAIVIQRAQDFGIQLCHEVAGGEIASYITWADDLGIGIQDTAPQVVSSVTAVLSILIDVATEHGLELSYGKGKTAVLIDFKGKGTYEHRQMFELACRAKGPMPLEMLYMERIRLLIHMLQVSDQGQTSCWLYHFRRFMPLSDDKVAALDLADREQGLAFHQTDRVTEKAKKSWQWATTEELLPALMQKPFEGDLLSEPTEDELLHWKTLGLLPPARGGRQKTERAPKHWDIPNVMKAINDLESDFLRQSSMWQVDFDWVPRPMLRAQKVK